jgi:tetratricopeptide (TPR) repeat protein
MTEDRANLTGLTTKPSDDATKGSLAECLDALDRLVRKGALEDGSRGYHLLAYLIDHHQKFGPGVPVKAYSIAVDVLERPTTFDPGEDSIVRVEVGRLRKLLEMYYRGPGLNDPVQFRLPRGQSHLEVEKAAQVSATPPPVQGRVFATDRRRWWSITLLAFASAIFTFVAILLMRPAGPSAEVAAALSDQFPRVFVRPFQKDKLVTEAFPNRALSSFLAAELSAFSTFRVIDPSSPSLLPVRAQDFVIDGIAALTEPALGAQDVEVRLMLKDGLGQILWSDELRYPLERVGSPRPTLEAISSIATKLGGAMGVIDTTGRSRLTDEISEWEAGASEFHCILAWQSFDLTKSEAEKSAARRCLEDLSKKGTRVSQIWAAFGFLRLLQWVDAGADPKDTRIDEALEAANKALLLDAEGADGHEALGSILTALGRFTEAREALLRATKINPSNLDNVVKLGWLDCLEGDWGKGLADVRTVIERYSVVPGWYRLPLALDAFRQNDPDEMLSQSEAIIASGDVRGQALAAIAARQMKLNDKELKHITELRDSGKTVVQALAELEALFPEHSIFTYLRAEVP